MATSDLDPVLCEYVEALWQQGDGRSLAQDALSGLQWKLPVLKGHLRGAWELTQAWQRLGLPARAPPLPPRHCLALAGWCLQAGYPEMAVGIVLAFHCVLRTGELLALSTRDVSINLSELSAVLDLGFTKSGVRKGVRESITVEQPWLVKALQAALLHRQPHDPLIQGGSNRFRRIFKDAVSNLGLDHCCFLPYSLRRGGATELWRRTGNLPKVTLRGRWAHLITVRIYVNDGLAVLTEIMTSSDENKIPQCFACLARTRLQAGDLC